MTGLKEAVAVQSHKPWGHGANEALCPPTCSRRGSTALQPPRGERELPAADQDQGKPRAGTRAAGFSPGWKLKLEPAVVAVNSSAQEHPEQVGRNDYYPSFDSSGTAFTTQCAAWDPTSTRVDRKARRKPQRWCQTWNTYYKRRAVENCV